MNWNKCPWANQYIHNLIACAYPLSENEGTNNELLPIPIDSVVEVIQDAVGRTDLVNEEDGSLVPSIEENKNSVDDSNGNIVLLVDLCSLMFLLYLEGKDDKSALAEPAQDLIPDIQTHFNVQNWNGGTVNTGLTIQTAYFIYNSNCSGTQCTAVKL